MIVSFDQAKREANSAKHGFDLADGGIVLRGLALDWVDDRTDYGEERWITTGSLRERIVLCVWAEDGHRCRIISLREATNEERRRYERWLANRHG